MSRYWCFHCYGLNDDPAGLCVHCSRPVQGPAHLTYDEQLVWTLGHPDGDRAILAAQTLGHRGSEVALPALCTAAEAPSDPFLAVSALRSAVQIAGADRLREWLERMAQSDSFLVQKAAVDALRRL
jgi:hypothetical protein